MDLMSVLKPKVLNKEITAVFAHSDETAIRIMNHVYDEKMSIPEQVSVVGFSDIEMASIYRPGLTTIKEPFYDYGAVAARRLLKEIDGETSDDVKTYLPARIVERETVN